MSIGIRFSDEKIKYWKQVGKVLDAIFEEEAKKRGCSKYVLSLPVKAKPLDVKAKLFMKKCAINAKEQQERIAKEAIDKEGLL
jgi:hypothetical protein